MRFPWQKGSSVAPKSTTPSTPEKSKEALEPLDGQRPTPEDENASPKASAERHEAIEQDVGNTGQSRDAAVEKKPGADLIPTASNATEASSVGEAGEEDESKYLKPLPLAILTFGLCLSLFVVALDNTIIGTLLRRICISTTDWMQQLPYRRSQQSSIR